jgi:hypothetical protein
MVFVLLFLVSSCSCIENTPCKDLESRWNQFVKKNVACDSDEDCTLHGQGNCGCPGFTIAAISKSALHEARKYTERLYSDECREHFLKKCGSVDLIPSQTKCVSGTCIQETRACFDPGIRP